MLIIADSSALVALATCNALDLVTQLESEIKVPKAVFEEVTISEKPYSTQLHSFLKTRVEIVDRSKMTIKDPTIGKGELEAIALYNQLEADWLLIDDRLARRLAENNGVSCIGVLGMLLQLKKKNIIHQISPLIDELRTSSIHYGEALLKRVLELAGE